MSYLWLQSYKYIGDILLLNEIYENNFNIFYTKLTLY